MQERKRALEMHTNIASAILAKIQSRGLDKYYVAEDSFPTNTVATALKEVEDLCNDLPANTSVADNDRARAILTLYLNKCSQLSDAQFSQLKTMLERSCGAGKKAALLYLKHMVSKRQQVQGFLQQQEAFASANSRQSLVAAKQTDLSQFFAVAGSFLNSAVAAGAQRLQQFIPHKRELVVPKIVAELMDNNQPEGEKSSNIQDRPDDYQRGSLIGASMAAAPMTENYVYIDPKVEPRRGGQTSNSARYRAPFKRGVVVMVGGGSFVEAQAVKDMAAESGRECIYTTTNFVAPEEFLAELEKLGAGEVVRVG